MTRAVRSWGMAILILGLISLVIGGAFIVQGITKNSELVQAMKAEGAVYEGDDANLGVIDTPEKAEAMAAVLRAHRLERYGRYTELSRDDPGRATILNAMTLENSLHLAHLGSGLVQLATVSGISMVIMGFALGGTGLAMRRISVAN